MQTFQVFLRRPQEGEVARFQKFLTQVGNVDVTSFNLQQRQYAYWRVDSSHELRKLEEAAEQNGFKTVEFFTTKYEEEWS